MADVTWWVGRLAAVWIASNTPVMAQLSVQSSSTMASQTAGSLSLLRAITTSLKKNPDIQISETLVTFNQGALQAAGGAFDPLVSANTNVTETNRKLRETNSSINIQQQLRSGFVLGSTLSVQSRNMFDTPPPGSVATLGLSIGFPVLRGRGTYLTSASENVAKLVLKKSEYDMRHAASVAIYSTAVAYWNLRAAQETLLAQRESEMRAQRLVGDIERLIKAGERPAADINLINGNLASKRVTRLAAEQDLINARLALSEKIGLDYIDFNATLNAGEEFPQYVGDVRLIENNAILVARATENRFDLKSYRTNLEALRIAVDSARDDLKPLLGVTIGANYAGNTTGENPLLVFGRRTGDPQLTATLNYTWDIVNNKSKGNYLSRSATYDQQIVVIRSLQASIGVGVENAVAFYNRSVQQLAETQSTVELYTKIVENEKKKLQIGSATLLDLVNVESQRQDVLLNHINQRAAYALSIAALRFQVGELIKDGPETPVLSPESLMFYDPNR